eukprot:150944-Amphidinium_carterae.1
MQAPLCPETVGPSMQSASMLMDSVREPNRMSKLCVPKLHKTRSVSTHKWCDPMLSLVQASFCTIGTTTLKV